MRLIFRTQTERSGSWTCLSRLHLTNQTGCVTITPAPFPDVTRHLSVTWSLQLDWTVRHHRLLTSRPLPLPLGALLFHVSFNSISRVLRKLSPLFPRKSTANFGVKNPLRQLHQNMLPIFWSHIDPFSSLERVYVYDYLTKKQMCESKFAQAGSSLLWCPEIVSKVYLHRKTLSISSNPVY